MSETRELLDKLQMQYPRRGCVSREPAWKWDFGTVVGNGSQGALAFCRTAQEEIVLSQEEMFLPLFPFHGYLPVREHYETVRQLVLDGKGLEAEALVRELKKKAGCPGYNTTDPFVGSCSLDLVMCNECEHDAYLRSINFETGEALTAWQDSTGLYHRHFFFSRADDVLVIRQSSPSGAGLNLAVSLREIAYKPPKNPKEQDIYKETIDRCEGTVTGTCLTHRMYFKKRWDTQPVNGCCTAARVIVKGGAASVKGDRLNIAAADEVILLVRTVPDRRGQSLSTEETAASLERIEPDYDMLLRRHAEIHGEIFNRCTLRLSAPEEQRVICEELQEGSKVGATTPALVEKAFDGARYALIGSTGRLPPALQGVWTGTWKPCWSGDYTTNGNVQSMVAASLCANHYECIESLMDYMDSLMDDFRDNARELLGFRGPLITWRSSTHGRTHYLAYKQYHHDYPGVYWFAGAAWFVQHYVDYYFYTGDETFMADRLKPFLLDCAEFYEDYLTLEQDGKYVLSPSSSPENQLDDGSWIAPNATMTIAAIKQLLRTLLMLKDKLGAGKDQIEKWTEMLYRMPPYLIGKKGALKEWAWPGIENLEKHRHASHLYPLWFGVDPEIAESEDLQEACRIAIDHRTKFRRPDNGGFMAFGFTQLGMAAAHLGDTELAYESVEYMANSYWSPMMVSQHNTYEFPDVLNVDISGGFPALIITMLVQALTPGKLDDPWQIRLLPCLPDAWPNGELKGTRCRGGFEIDLSWKEGKLLRAKVKSQLGKRCRIEYGDFAVPLELGCGETAVLSPQLERMSE